MGMGFWFVTQDGDLVDDAPVHLPHWTYSNTHRVLVELGGLGLREDDGSERYFVNFDPPFLANACEKWFAIDGSRESLRRQACDKIMSNVLPNDDEMMAYRIGILREMGEWGWAKGYRSVSGG
jgi:hypothetical protein